MSLHPPLVLASLGDQGASGVYRVLHPLLTMNTFGLIQLRMPPGLVFYPADVVKNMKPDAILFHRSHTMKQQHYLQELRENVDSLLVYTIDDYVEKVPKYSEHFDATPKDIGKEIRKAIKICDRLIVTNDYLANIYGYKKDTYVIPNYLSYSVWSTIYNKAPELKKSDKPRIGWSGALGHSGDLEILREVADILGDSVQWVFLGPTPKGFDYGNAEVHPPVNPRDYQSALFSLNLDLALAPLLDNEFNMGKSNLRILEYAACGYPVIASDVRTFKQDNPPVTLLPYKAQVWAEKIQEKLKDMDRLAQEGKDLQKWVWDNYQLEKNLDKYLNVLDKDINHFVPQEIEIKDSVDVVITTHNNFAVVKDCIDSVLHSLPQNKTNANVIVCDNNSIEQELVDYLNNLASDGKISLLRSSKDDGYINNVNRGLTEHNDLDAIILNSDTIVHGDWIDRMRKIAKSNERIASVTPFTNYGTLVSYPDPAGSEMQKALVNYYDEVASELDHPVMDLPTPVGFCMYMNRDTINEIGLFDSNAFGRGYGEENDWAMRATNRQWKHVVAHNVYVGHVNEATFKAEKQTLLKNANEVLSVRWPYYFKIIEQWLQSNPLSYIRQKMDLMSLKKTSISPRTLFITHNLGGGAETYMQQRLQTESNAMIARCDPMHPGFIKMEVNKENYFNLPYLSSKMTDLAFLTGILHDSNVELISLQTTFGYDYNMPTWIMNLSKVAKIPYEVILHDYFTVCPRLRLTPKFSYCGEPDVDECNKCIIENGSVVGQVDVESWRNMYYRLLKGATRLTAPSHDLVNRLHRYYPDLLIDVVPHELEVEIGEYKPQVKWRKGDLLKVACIGFLTPDKGSLLIQECANYCAKNKLPIEFVVFGTLIDTKGGMQNIPKSDNLKILGQYKEEDLKKLLIDTPCHLSFFPALWPETYSYTLSHAFRASLRPIAFNMGAIAERIRNMQYGETIDFAGKDDVPYIVDCIQRVAETINN